MSHTASHQASGNAESERDRGRQMSELCEVGQSFWTQSAPEKPSVGRPPKRDIERLRAQTWYWKVKSLCPEGWSDAELDRQFGGQAGINRLKIFERIRREGWFPQTVDASKASTRIKRPKNLVDVVDQSPGFGGTKTLLHAPFWTALGRQAADPTSVRLALNELLDQNGLVRLEGGLNGIVDEQVREIVLRPDKRLSYVSSGGVYVHWLEWELSRIPGAFERLTFVGLLLREALLLACLDHVFILWQIARGQISRIAGQSWLMPLQREFTSIVGEYMLRGHVSPHDEADLYRHGGAHDAIRGYVVGKDSAFLGDSDGIEEKTAWSQGLGHTCQRVAATLHALDGQWDLSDESYHEAAHQEWLRDRDDPTVVWPECPNDGGSLLSNRDG